MHLRIAIVDGGSSGMVMATVSSSTSPWCASPRFVNHMILTRLRTGVRGRA